MDSKRIAILLFCVAGATAFVIPNERHHEEDDFSGEAIDLWYSCVTVKTLHSADESQAPILLMHGIGSDHNSWSGIHEVLAMQTGRRVCRVDARNHGKSPWSEEFSVDLMVEDTIHLMDRLNMPKAILLGHSMGGAMALKLTLDYPERVEKLIVEDQRVSPSTQEENAHTKALIEMLFQSLDAVPPGSDEEAAKDAVIKFIREYLSKISGGEDLEKVLARYRSTLDCSGGKCNFKIFLNASRKALEDPNFMTHILEGCYDGGALFVYGQLSEEGVENDKEKILKLFPHAKFAEIKGSGHLIHAEKSKEFLDVVVWFIKENFIVSK